MNHRKEVGGKWNEIGKLQFDFMIKEGLKPGDILLDIACGSLRGGIHFIKYLNKGNYLGIDMNKELIEKGLNKELKDKSKEPEFVISDKFDFNFSKKPNYSIAISLFTHLNKKDISLCLKNLHKFVGKGHIFYTTFFEKSNYKNPNKSHPHKLFRYSRKEMINLAKECGWNAEYIKWKHPRKQKMLKLKWKQT